MLGMDVGGEYGSSIRLLSRVHSARWFIYKWLSANQRRPHADVIEIIGVFAALLLVLLTTVNLHEHPLHALSFHGPCSCTAVVQLVDPLERLEAMKLE